MVLEESRVDGIESVPAAPASGRGRDGILKAVNVYFV